MSEREWSSIRIRLCTLRRLGRWLHAARRRVRVQTEDGPMMDKAVSMDDAVNALLSRAEDHDERTRRSREKKASLPIAVDTPLGG